MYYVQSNQQIQQPQQQQQQPAPTQNIAIQASSIDKPKPKRTCEVVIRDPKDNKDITDEFITGSTGAASPSNWTFLTESSTIQAQFTDLAYARVGGEKDKQVKLYLLYYFKC